MAVSPNKSMSSPSNFGGAVVDANRIATGFTANFQTTDASGTPKASPLTVSTTILTLVVPQNAVSVHLYATGTAGTNDIKVSEDSGVANWFLLPAGQILDLDVARQQNIYLVRAGGADGTLNFAFKTL